MPRSEFQTLLRYWREVWKRRPRSRTYAPGRAIPSILVAVIVFLVRHQKAQSASLGDMWILIGITIGVYLFLYAAETVWNFAVISPADLHAEQVKINYAQVEQIEALKESRQVNFDFDLLTSPEKHTSMSMVHGKGASYSVPVPLIGVAVSNKGERHIEVIACHFSKRRQSDSNVFRTGKHIDPKSHGDVDVTEHLVRFLAGLNDPDLNKIFGSYQVDVAVECRADQSEKPVKMGPKCFDVEIANTGEMALKIGISPARG